MRQAFINTLIEIADKDTYLITNDVGYSVLEGFKDKFARQYLNLGIAEQNIMGVASGLALTGKKVFIYGITPFVTLRCLEQIKLDICYHNLDVVIMGMGVGYHYKDLGISHYALDDIGIMRLMPNMTVISPASSEEMAKVIKNLPFGPVYIRMGKSSKLYKSAEFEVGKGIVVREGEEMIITTGAIIDEALKTDKGVINIHTLKPIDKDLILKYKDRIVDVIEEHGVGGLRSIVSEILWR